MPVASARERDDEPRERDHGGGQRDHHGLDLDDDASFRVGDAVLDLLLQVPAHVSTCSRPCASAQVLAKPVFNPHRSGCLLSRSSGFVRRI
jgi:hypothetical protein